MTTPWLFAAAAVLYVLWSGRRPAAGVPVLPPIGLPGLAPPVTLAGPAAAPPGAGWALFVALLVWSAFLVWIATAINTPGNPTPPPEPAPAAGLDLRGRFVGPDAAHDAATTAALLAELADVVEFDGRQPTPRIATGAAVHDLRTAARELRCRGVKLGDKQPAVRDAIKTFLDEKAGTDGGPLDADERAKWVAAYREVAKAAEAAAR